MKVEVHKSSEERNKVRKGRAGEESPYMLEENVKRRRYSPRESSVESRSRSPLVIVWRPHLGGKSVPIPEGLKLKKEKRLEIIQQQVEALTKTRAKACPMEEKQGNVDAHGSMEGQNMEIGMEPSPTPLPQRKPRLRILENIQLVPPRDSQAGKIDQVNEGDDRNKTGQDEWIKVSRKERRKEKRKRKGEAPNQPVSGPPLPPSEGAGKTKEIGKPGGTLKRKVPKTAAVCIKGNSEGFSYAEALRKARTSISLADLQIGSPRIRKGVNGATIIEIAGPDNNEKADKLVAKLQEVIADAVVTRPTIKGELRLISLEESITKSEIEFAIADAGGCKIQDVLVGEIRPTKSGLNTVWLRCPLTAAVTVANKSKIPIGWSMIKVELLRARPVRCFHCWEVGHSMRGCKSDNDYSWCCFRCGNKGHQIKLCKNAVRCVLCSKLKRDSSHRMGSPQCESGRAAAITHNEEASERRNEDMCVETGNNND
ncbi:CCHC-type domain-containing protein [Camponotus japonicus]